MLAGQGAYAYDDASGYPSDGARTGVEANGFWAGQERYGEGCWFYVLVTGADCGPVPGAPILPDIPQLPPPPL
ncbi:MAG: hypothetical protein LC624_06085 [Halobacteriales archaeon]|nr:hypothetical protein [Halobacteriales archaeon]